MEYRLLGPLEVGDGTGVLVLGGKRQRLVLASLLLHANRDVSTDWLIFAVWGDEPPRTARKTLKAYIARLRGVLGPGVIDASSTGYVLHALPEQIDAARFEELAGEGRRLLSTEPKAAADLLARALGLWRGAPWGELGHEPALLPAAERLREMRLEALEDRIAADLETGRAVGVIGELQGLVDEHPFRERPWGMLMLALYRSGRQTEALRTYQEARHRLGEELGIEPGPDLTDLENRILLHDPELAGPAPVTEEEDWTLARIPYKGLRAFDEEDGSDFFGRADLVDELRERVDRDPLVAVVGASGSGKSSVVRAGLLPRLRADPNGRWMVVTMMPGRHPFAEAWAALEAVAPRGGSLQERRGDDLDLLRAAQSVLPGDRHRLLLVIDQFEELLHQPDDQQIAADFIRNLAEAVEDPHSRLTVLITLRADYFDRALDYPPLGAMIRSGMVGVLPLTASQLEAAAARPAERVGVHLEPELIAELIADTVNQAGSLPLFQYVLTELFAQRTSSILTRSGYRRLGGLQGALGRRAEETFASLGPEAQAAARQVFLRLVTVVEGGDDSRRREERSELEALDPGVGEVLEAFDAARLMAFDRHPVTGGATVEVVHEALLREWPRLRRWLDEAEADLRLHRALAAAVAEWAGSDRNPDYLLTGSRLALYEGWAGPGTLKLTPGEREFLEAAEAADAARRKEKAQLQRRSVRRLRWLVAAVSAAALIATGLSLLAADRGREATVRGREARARELANAAVVNTDTDPDLAILLALEAVDTTRSADGSVLREAEEALHAAVNAHRVVGSVPGQWSVEFHPDGRLFTGGETARLIDSSTGRISLDLPPPAADAEFTDVDVSGDGSLLAAGTDRQGDVVVWDAATGAQVHSFLGPGDTATSVQLSPDNRLLASVHPGLLSVRVWDLGSGELARVVSDPDILTFCCPPVRLRFSPDGTRLAVTMSTEVKVFDVASGDLELTLVGHEGLTSAVEFLPNGGLVTAGYDGTVRLWDAATGAARGVIDAGGTLLSLAVSPAGDRLLSGDDRGAVTLWALQPGTARPLAGLTGPRSQVFALAFDPDGRLGAGVSGTTVQIWDVTPAGPGEMAAWSGDGAVAFSPDGNRLAYGGPGGGEVSIVETTSWSPMLVVPDVAPFVGEERPVWAEEWGVVGGLAFGSDGTVLATVTTGFEVVDGTVALWNSATGEHLHTLLEHSHLKGPVAFSGDGTRVAAATCGMPGPVASVWDVATGALVYRTPSGRCGQAVDLDGPGGLLAVQTIDENDPNIRIYDTGTGEVTASFSHMPMWIGAVQFSSNDELLLTAGGSGTARIWEAASGERVVSLEGHTGPVETAVWTGDGARVVTSSADGTIRCWDAATGEMLLVLSGLEEWAYIALSPDGRSLASSAAGTVQIWALDLDHLVEIARSRVTRSLTSAECVTYHFEDCGLHG